ncbi:hypothetical protein ANN_26871 [Periplaneta americana]|uniref:Nuclease HARBI1 n=1 Tax=Periplaneta americana TaxID=6978 RepID=A0ABQ8RZH7_PERAM|nr:hypothetical protein ANN_26871 [Periplaneta americana]
MEHFRVSRQVAEGMAEKFSRSEYFHHQAGGNGKLGPLQFVLIFLWFVGHQTSSFRDVADRFNVTISTLFRVVRRMMYFVSNLSEQIIMWPTADEIVEIEQYFRHNHFPGVIGIIDGTHIRIDRPKNDPDSYLNRKHFYSVQLYHVKLKNIRDIVHLIRACCVLHNIAIEDHFQYEAGAENDERLPPPPAVELEDEDEERDEGGGVARRNQVAFHVL